MTLWKKNKTSEMDDISQHPIMRGLKFACENESFKPQEFWEVTGLIDDYYGRETLMNIVESNCIIGKGDNDTLTVNYEAFINYLEYIELKEARTSSKRAMRIAIAAIMISILIGIISIVVSLTNDADVENTYFPPMDDIHQQNT